MIPDYMKKNFNTLVRAAKDDNLSLLECTCATTGEVRYVVTAIVYDDETEEYIMTPFGHMSNENPYEAYTPPI